MTAECEKMANEDLVKKFVELQAQTTQLLEQGKLAEAKQKYLSALESYHEIDKSALEKYHKELAYSQVTSLFRKVNEAKERFSVPYNLIIAGLLVFAFSTLVFLKPSVVGLASLENTLRQNVDLNITESSLHQITLKERPLSLAASGQFVGKIKLYLKQGEKLSLIYEVN